MVDLGVQFQSGLTIGVMLCAYLVFILRKHHRDFPVFHQFFVVLLIGDVVMFFAFLACHPVTYFWVYWSCQLVTIVTLVKWTVAVLSRQIGPFGLRKPHITIPPMTFSLGLFAAAGVIVSTIRSMGPNTVPQAFLTNVFTGTQQATVGVALGFLAASFLISWVLSIHWERREVGIVAGVLVDNVTVAVLFRVLGGLATMETAHAYLLARLCATCIWLYVFADERPELMRLTGDEREQIRDILRRIGGSLKESDQHVEENGFHGIRRGEITCARRGVDVA